MSLWAGDPVGVGLSLNGIAVSRGGRIERLVRAPPSPETADSQEWSSALSVALNGVGRRAKLRWTLAPGLLRWMTVDAPSGTTCLRELRAYAESRFEDHFGEPPLRWAICGDWRASGTSLCSALPLGLAQAIERKMPAMSWSVASSMDRAMTVSGGSPRGERVIWIEIVGGCATILWLDRGRARRAIKVMVDEHHPWERVEAEVLRAPIGHHDGWAVNWISPSAPSVAARLPWVRRTLPAGRSAMTSLTPECWAASLGELA